MAADRIPLHRRKGREVKGAVAEAHQTQQAFECVCAEINVQLMEEGAQPSHGISLYVDDLEAAIALYTERGVAFKGDVQDHGWGLVTEIDVPGCGALMLYQPRYKSARTPGTP